MRIRLGPIEGVRHGGSERGCCGGKKGGGVWWVSLLAINGDLPSEEVLCEQLKPTDPGPVLTWGNSIVLQGHHLFCINSVATEIWSRDSRGTTEGQIPRRDIYEYAG